MNKIKMSAMIVIILIVISITTIVYKQIKIHRTLEKEKSKQERIDKYLPIIEPLLERVQSVMSGEVLIEDDEDYLKRYNFNSEIYKDVETLTARITVMDVDINGDSGYIDARYSIIRKNKKGEVISSGGDDVRWTIEKREEWEIVDCQAMDFY